MPRRLERILDGALKIRPGEGTRVLLMAAYAASAIGALVVGRTVRDTLFLADRTKDDLPLMYVVNSVAVALLSWGYARFADGLRRDRVNALVALGWALVMSVFFGAALVDSHATAPVLYVAVEAMGALVVIQFWTFAQDVFNAREAKRLFGLIGAGGQAANVLYGFLAAGISRRFGAESLLLVCVANLVACAGLAWYVGRRHGAAAPVLRPRPRTGRRRLEPRRPQAQRHGSLRSLMTPHLVTVAAIAVLGALAVNLVDFQFKAAAEQHIDDRRELGAFFGKFYGICGAVALAIQMGLTGRVLERFGILASLLPLPIGLAAGSLAAFHFPSGWTASLAKGSDSIFRYTINDASMQLLYVPVPSHQRGRAKALIDGVLRPSAGVVAGLLLLWLTAGRTAADGPLRPDGLITAAILGLVACWILLLLRGRREYVRALLDTLQTRRLDLRDSPITADQATANALAKVLQGDDALAILHALELLPHARGRDFGPELSRLLQHRISSVRAAAADVLARQVDRRFAERLRKMLDDPDPWCVASAIGALCALEKENALPLVGRFIQDPRPALRAAVVVGLVRHAGLDGILFAAEELKRQLHADSVVERELAARVLGLIGVRTFYSPLVRFLNDPSPRVRRGAVVAAGRLASPELVPHLLPCLAQRETARETAQALAGFGPGIEVPLGDALLSTDTDPAVRQAIPAVLARIGTREAAQVLHAALTTHPVQVRAAAARSLARILRRRTDVRVTVSRVTDAVRVEIATAEELLAMQRALDLPSISRTAPSKNLQRDGARLLLSLALVEEKDRAIQRAIALLELLHPNAGLDVVADNLRSEIPARRANAVEVLDNTIREELKKFLLPLLEDRLLSRVSVPHGPKDRLLSELIAGSRPWLAACAARVAADAGLRSTLDALTSGLRSPVAYVREACASAIQRLAPERGRELAAVLEGDPAASVRRIAARAGAVESADALA